MQWWAWIVVGAILLGSELTVVNAQFYLVFLGAAALIVGMIDLLGVHFADWMQWLTFGLLSALSMVSFRRRIYERLRRTLPSMNAGPKGESVLLPAPLPPGGSCRVEFRGASWNVQNGGHTLIEAGAHARIDRVDGLTLIVHAEPSIQ
jgi:membrane protein implicated in regulation of membrane protease activity